MRSTLLIVFLALFLRPCFAELEDEIAAKATAHYESMIYATVASRLSDDIENAQLPDAQETEWLDAIVNRLAVCHLDALNYLGADTRAEVLQAFATGAGNQGVSEIISKRMKSESNFQATLAAYSDVRNQCTDLINQEFGINYY